MSGVSFINSGADINVGVLEETVPGTIETGAAYELILNTGINPDFPSSRAEAEETGDHGGPRGVRTLSRGGNVDFPMNFRYGANRIMEANAFRDDWASEVTVTGVADIDYLIAGTHQDGATGQLQLKTTTGGFDALRQYAGALDNGAFGLTLLLEGFPFAGNNQPVLCKAVWDDATFAYVDIWIGYGNGTIGDPFGAPKAQNLAASGIIHAGAAIRNRRRGAASRRTLSVMVDRYRHDTTGRFRGISGWVANDLSIEVPGKGRVSETVTGNGRGWTNYQMTPLNGMALESHFVDNNPLNDFFIGGEDLRFLSLVSYPRASFPGKPILLSDKNVNQFSWSQTGGVNVIDDIVGTDQLMPRRGSFGFDGSISWYVADDQVIEDITLLGARDGHQKAAVHLIFQAPDGTWKGLTLPKNEFEQSGGSGGGDGEESGTLSFGSETIGKEGRTAILQEWSAF